MEQPATRTLSRVIVQAWDSDDVVEAIRYARANGHRVGVRSGGHSWAASHLRDGGLLLDVAASITAASIRIG
jgi:FAD/FMN-containing dehydrogenase